MLPTTLLPTGILDTMRTTAEQFMQQPVTLFKPILSYDLYGKQIVASGSIVHTSGYVGNLTGRDKEFLSRTQGISLYRSGMETKTIATLLVPVETVIDNDYQVVISGARFNVIWHTGATMDGVQLYQKAIIAEFVRQDEIRNV